MRLRALRALLAYAAATVVSFVLTPDVMDFFVREGAALQGLVFLSPAEAFLARVKLALALGLLLGLPFMLYQLWALFAPAMDRRQKRITLLFLPAAYALFLGGVLFALFGVLPIALRFFLSFGGESLQQEISVGNYVSFLISFSLPFGAIFELPMVILLLARLGVIDDHMLRRNRKYAIFAIFVVAGALTPADALSQIMMAVPLLFLYEVGVVLARFASKARGSNPPVEEREGESEDPAP